MGISLAILASLIAGVIMAGVAIAMGLQAKQRRLLWIAGGLLFALLINSWWLSFAGLLLFKTLVLRQDT